MAPEEIRWSDLLTEYKYRPGELLTLVDSSPDVRKSISSSLERAWQPFVEWPVTLRDWRLILVELMENEVGGILSPYARSAVHKELLLRAAQWGITPTALRLASVEIDSVESRLEDQVLRMPEGWRVATTSGK